MLEKIIIALIVLAVVGLVVALFVLPSCEDQGLKTVFSHFQYVYNGKTNTLIPIYICQ